MRRIGRWMVNALTALSLLLCVATCVLWVRSYWVGESWTSVAQNSVSSVGSAGGFVHLGYFVMVPRPNVHYTFSPPPQPGYHAKRYSPSVKTPTQWQFLGFGGTHVQSTDMTLTYLRFPDWAIVAIAAIGPLVWIIPRRKIPPGRCRSCHYDLTGNVSGVCPECGTNIAIAE